MLLILFNRVSNSRFFPLFFKEINQIIRDKNLLIFLLFSPIIQLLIFGYSINPDIQKLKLGVVNYDNNFQSRELISALTQNQAFNLEIILKNEKELSEKIKEGKLTIGLIIPPDFSQKLNQDKITEIQIIIDGVDANTAGVSWGYIKQIIRRYNQKLNLDQVSPLIIPQTIFLYNPGLISSWFFVPGIMGAIFTLTSSLVSSGTVIREKDTGTLEQLLMTPSEAWEILLAKIVPLFILLMGNVFLSLELGIIVFKIPLRGNFVLFMVLSGVYILIGIGIGIILATISRTQQQAFLLSFFVNLPLIQLSGSIAPLESMPLILKYFSLLNPLRHYVNITRAIMIKGLNLDILWPEATALVGFALLILSIGINRFHRQLS
ncbi:MAG: ABC transporter permease [Microcystis aeruginosa Ma_QC_B_20070730_S2]|jgi:ABC-2 type transport system permease protein|uniref:Transport permease protein n=1 Tax=Microcystis aeruginosa Ma_QC_B_20070730_S2 TaxID=2486256 RepID=A0A552D5T3_MICAE|nr:MAG: ABC transporter permease [Microcystis aeruginosa Ma_QC_B_20070730_S2]